MQSNAARVGIVAAAVVAAVVLFVVLNDTGGDGDDGATTPTPATTATGTPPTTAAGDANVPQVITIRDGEPVGGVETLTYQRGDRVDLEVRLDQPEEEIHVHGYEISEPGRTSPVRLLFTADIDGIFEIEVHRLDGSESQIAELKVNP